jgi:hypothetical protein
MQHPDTAFEWVARLGYASRGLIYLILGGLALFSGGFGGAENSTGALSTLLTQPFGRILLAIMALGFFGFAAWRVAQGLFNADNLAPGLKSGFVRAGKALSAAANVSLGGAAAGMALGLIGGSSEGSEEGWAARLMSLPFGPYLVGAVGLVIVGAGIGQIWKAFSGKYREPLDILPRLEKLLILICTYGIAARGVVFCILGGFLVYAGIVVEPNEAGSMGDALDWVRGLPFGGVLFILAAIGLIAFAASCVIFALYRRVDAPGAGEMGDHARSMARKATAHVR